MTFAIHCDKLSHTPNIYTEKVFTEFGSFTFPKLKFRVRESVSDSAMSMSNFKLDEYVYRK